MKSLKKIFTFLILILIISSCNNKPKKHNIKVNEAKKTLKGVNKYLVQDDVDVMVGYSRRNGWDMKIDSTGML